MIESNEVQTIRGTKYSINENGEEIARAYLYVMKNDLHDKPFGFVEDVFVHENYRENGLGSKLVNHLVEEAKKQDCYKLMLTVKNPEEHLHPWYQSLGFEYKAKEYRIDF